MKFANDDTFFPIVSICADTCANQANTNLMQAFVCATCFVTVYMPIISDG